MKENITVAQLAQLVDGEVEGSGDLLVQNFAAIEVAAEGDISFVAKESDGELLQLSSATAIIVPKNMQVEARGVLLRVDDPYLAVAKIHSFLLEEDFVPEGIHRSAYIGEGCHISSEVTIKALAAIGNRVTIGARVRIETGVVVGDDVVIGDDCILRANVTIANESQLGNRVMIDSGTVIGSDGYGYATDKMGFHHKRPQVGIVRIDDDVEIGANSCVDRAAYGTTWIKSGVKIDNQVQVAHNVVIGENSLIVAQVGLSGSSTLGRNVVMGGKSSTAGHLEIGDQAMVAAGSGVASTIPAKTVVGGVPAIPIKQWRRAAVCYGKLPEMHKELRALRKQVAQLQQEKHDRD